MKNLYLDQTTGDLVIENFNFRLTSTDVEYYAQKIENVVKVNYKEYFLNRDAGIPYWGPNGLVMKKNPDLDTVQALIINEIASIQGIDSIEKYAASLDNSTRTYTAQIRVVTTSGAVIDREITL